MARSKHTDPRSLRAARRLRAPREGRGANDVSDRRRQGKLARQLGGAVSPSAPPPSGRPPGPRIVTRKPRHGFHHPAGRQDILKLLDAVGPVAIYGLRWVELVRASTAAASLFPAFGNYVVPGRIVLYEQPLPPWRVPGILPAATTRRLEGFGAILTTLPGASATVVDWPKGTLRRFMLEEVLLHEVGHHVLQHHKGKRSVRIARTRDHEAFAARFAEKQRAMLIERQRQ